jgi:hypothetical protein
MPYHEIVDDLDRRYFLAQLCADVCFVCDGFWDQHPHRWPGQRPFGFFETEWDAAQRIFILRASGLGFAAIAKILNEDGIPAKRRGTKWHTETVNRAVWNIKYEDEKSKRSNGRIDAALMPLPFPRRPGYQPWEDYESRLAAWKSETKRIKERAFAMQREARLECARIDENFDIMDENAPTGAHYLAHVASRKEAVHAK